MPAGTVPAATGGRTQVEDLASLLRMTRRAKRRVAGRRAVLRLAVSLGATLVTTDPRLADAAGEIVEFVRFRADGV
jgi:hypothetical protein